LIVLLVLTLFGVGYLVRAGVDSSGRPHVAPVPTRKLTASDLLLAASSAEGIHLRYQGITTGALNSQHSNDIPITSFSFGVHRPATTSSAGARTLGKARQTEVTVTHTLDEFSLPLLNASIKGSPVAASLYFTDLSGIEGADLDYLEFNLGATVITDYSTSSGGDRPNESLALNFTSMTVKYRIGNGGGPLNSVTYNFATQK
jgi:type VI protein secretion system component Hcp